MNKSFSILLLSLLFLLAACDTNSSDQKKETADKQQATNEQASTADNPTDQSTISLPPEDKAAATMEINTLELNQQEMERFISQEMLLEVMEIAFPDQIQTQTTSENQLEVTWPLDNGTGDKARLILTRGDAFDGSADSFNEASAAYTNPIFFDDIGVMGGFYERTATDQYMHFPMGGYMYKISLPNNAFPEEMMPEKARHMAQKILEGNM